MSLLCQFNDKKSQVTWMFFKNAWVSATTICSYRGSIPAISQTFDYTRATINPIGGMFLSGESVERHLLFIQSGGIVVSNSSTVTTNIKSIATTGGAKLAGVAIETLVLNQASQS
jgi:hypothetical protein